MKPSQSLFLEIRGLRYHVRRWPREGARKLFLLHGWMDVSASFQFLADALGGWDIYAPDWRGYGLTQWGKSDCYWFPDYIGDLDFLLEEFEPGNPVNLVGHSLGGNVACLYAGVRPQRVAKLVNLEGFGLKRTRAEDAPRRYARWLEELRQRPRLRTYKDFDELAARLRQGNPRLSAEKASFLARQWGHNAGEQGVLLRGDPAHKIVNPVLWRYEEMHACWQQVTAPVLWVDAAASDTLQRMGLTQADHAERRAAFRTLRYETVADAGHMLHHDQPEAVARLIEEFLNEDLPGNDVSR
ncbi:MAG TPA: alpha/beta hydrolase [Burkholderiales bacterium]|nr:alpha/beta hydrolase [Burkholderiales bacterium]